MESTIASFSCACFSCSLPIVQKAGHVRPGQTLLLAAEPLGKARECGSGQWADSRLHGAQSKRIGGLEVSLIPTFR